VKQIAMDFKNQRISLEDINESLLDSYLLTKEYPDPDLLIRTSGELRLSNFMLWQLAYSELFFTDVLWPDFKRENFYEAIREYQNRSRRFGALK
jgi:undecaprenyl diphosphate synthase